MQEMLEQQQQLTEVGFGTGLRAHRVFANLADLEEYSLKYLLTGERFYLDDASSRRVSIDNDLHEMLRVNLFVGPLGDKTRAVVTGWNECSAVIDQLEAGEGTSEGAEQRLDESCAGAYDALEDLIRAGDDYLVETAAQTRETGQRVTSVSRIALPVALLLAAVVTLVVFRSISVSLKEMMRGAQQIAKGDFEVKLRQDRGDELSDLAIVLNRMTRRLGELDRLKRDFVSHVSHDLRAPLASVEETTRLLLDEFSEGLDQTQIRLLELSLASGRRLSRLIGNLLDLSRIDAGVIAYDFQRLELKQAVEECLESLQGLFLDKQLTVEVKSDSVRCWVHADRLRLGRVVENLLFNAVEFSPPKGTIEVEIERVRRSADHPDGFVTAEDGSLCLLSVSDQGPGIPPSERDRIFDQFYTSGRQDSKVKKGGTGLGLTIAKRIVEAHDGEIWVQENASGQGSCFCILLGFASLPESGAGCQAPGEQ
jgi:two-component system sensor histidine kinase GlrK